LIGLNHPHPYPLPSRERKSEKKILSRERNFDKDLIKGEEF